MGRGRLNDEEVRTLLESPWVDGVDREHDRIKWKECFKEHFVEEYKAGKMPLQIFTEAGFTKEILGTKRIERAASRWREIYRVPTRKKVKR